MNNQEKNELIKQIQNLYSETDQIKQAALLMKLLHKYQNYRLPGAVLKEIFLIVNPPDEDGFSKSISIDELSTYNIGFKTTNGGDWCRSNSSALGKDFNIVRVKDKGRITAIRLDGYNKKLTINQSIRSDIVQEISSRRCAILDISTNIEVDHKNGKKDEHYMNDLEKQSLDDFQALSKAANDAKRSHCKKCISSGKRYDAKKLGYSVSFTKGDFDTANCQGCYWYDPVKFNMEISKNYNKDR